MASNSRESSPIDTSAVAPSRDEKVHDGITQIVTDEQTSNEDEKAPPLPDEPVPEDASEASDESTDAVNTDLLDANSPLPNEEVPPLPNESLPDVASGDAPPVPTEVTPEDDGWDYGWDYATSQYIFFNRFTGAEQLENPRLVSSAPKAGASTAAETPAEPTPPEILGYNPAIHGDYDPNAWYAKLDEAPGATTLPATDIDVVYNVHQAAFNRFTGHFQTEGEGAEKHTGDAKARRQLNSYFDVDAAANAHKGKSLKAERQGKKLSKSELKQFKEKRKARKEEKRRAWLMD